MIDSEVISIIKGYKDSGSTKELMEFCGHKFLWLRDNYPESIAIKLLMSNDKIRKAFMSSRASTKFHGAYSGGLFCHTILVTLKALELSKVFDESIRPTDIDIVDTGLLHDLGKIGKVDSDGEVLDDFYYMEGSRYQGNWDLISHGTLGIFNLQKMGITLPYDVWVAIMYHNGMYAPDFDMNVHNRETPLLLIAHWSDMYVSRLFNV